MPEHVHWEGPSPLLVLTAFAAVLLILVGLTWWVQHNCATFHVCSDIVRDRPRVFAP